MRAEWGAGDEALVFGTVGAYVDHKDPLNLVAAWRLARERTTPELKSARLVFVGEGDQRSAMETAIAAAGMRDSVTLTGWRQDVGDCLAAMDVFVMPSKLEGLCTSLIDAQAVGLACVATAAGGIPDVITDGVNGLLAPPRNANALADRLIQVATDAALRKRLASAGPRIAEEKFSVQRMVEGNLAVYRRVADL